MRPQSSKLDHLLLFESAKESVSGSIYEQNEIKAHSSLHADQVRNGVRSPCIGESRIATVDLRVVRSLIGNTFPLKASGLSLQRKTKNCPQKQLLVRVCTAGGFRNRLSKTIQRILIMLGQIIQRFRECLRIQRKKQLSCRWAVFQCPRYCGRGTVKSVIFRSLRRRNRRRTSLHCSRHAQEANNLVHHPDQLLKTAATGAVLGAAMKFILPEGGVYGKALGAALTGIYAYESAPAFEEAWHGPERLIQKTTCTKRP